MAFAAGHPAPVVGPAAPAPAVLDVADVTAAAVSPREVAAAPVMRTAIGDRIEIRIRSILGAWYCHVEIRKNGQFYRYRLGLEIYFAIGAKAKTNFENWRFLTRMQCFSKFFRKKLRVPQRAVEIDIFADLTISKGQKWYWLILRRFGLVRHQQQANQLSSLGNHTPQWISYVRKNQRTVQNLYVSSKIRGASETSKTCCVSYLGPNWSFLFWNLRVTQFL